MVRWLRFPAYIRRTYLSRSILLLDRKTIFREVHRTMLSANNEFPGTLTKYQVSEINVI